MNELFFFSFILIDLFAALLFFRLFGKSGLVVFHILHVILVQITINLHIDIWGHTIVFGSVLFAILFMSTDILTEHYGKKEGYKTVQLGAATLVMFLIIINFGMLLKPSETATLNETFNTLFKGQWRITVADLIISYFALQSFNVWLYDKIRNWTNGAHLWLRNNLATFVSQTLIAVLFFQMAFAGSMPQSELWEIILSGLVLKYAISLFDTPFVYLSKKFLPKDYHLQGKVLT